MTAPTSYCSTADVESILSSHGVTGFMDDDNDTTRDGSESTDISNAIQRSAATDINFMIGQRYDLANQSSHPWLKWANAILAAFQVAMRRNQAASKSLVYEVNRIRENLKALRDNTMDLYDMPSRFDDLPSVSNMKSERWRGVTPVRVVRQESTRAEPEGDIKRKASATIPWVD